MNTKTILIIGAVAVVGYYFWNKSKTTTVVAATKEGTSNAGGRTGRTCLCSGIGNVYTTNDSCYGVCENATKQRTR